MEVPTPLIKLQAVWRSNQVLESSFNVPMLISRASRHTSILDKLKELKIFV